MARGIYDEDSGQLPSLEFDEPDSFGILPSLESDQALPSLEFDETPAPVRSGIAFDDGQVEQDFQTWYKDWARKAEISSDPDAPGHKYDYRAAYRNGQEPVISKEDGRYHWPSEHKSPDHPNRFVDGFDTISGEPVRAPGLELLPTPSAFNEDPRLGLSPEEVRRSGNDTRVPGNVLRDMIQEAPRTRTGRAWIPVEDMNHEQFSKHLRNLEQSTFDRIVESEPKRSKSPGRIEASREEQLKRLRPLDRKMQLSRENEYKAHEELGEGPFMKAAGTIWQSAPGRYAGMAIQNIAPDSDAARGIEFINDAARQGAFTADTPSKRFFLNTVPGLAANMPMFMALNGVSPIITLTALDAATQSADVIQYGDDWSAEDSLYAATLGAVMRYGPVPRFLSDPTGGPVAQISKSVLGKGAKALEAQFIDPLFGKEMTTENFYNRWAMYVVMDSTRLITLGLRGQLENKLALPIEKGGLTGMSRPHAVQFSRAVERAVNSGNKQDVLKLARMLRNTTDADFKAAGRWYRASLHEQMKQQTREDAEAKAASESRQRQEVAKRPALSPRIDLLPARPGQAAQPQAAAAQVERSLVLRDTQSRRPLSRAEAMEMSALEQTEAVQVFENKAKGVGLRQKQQQGVPLSLPETREMRASEMGRPLTETEEALDTDILDAKINHILSTGSTAGVVDPATPTNVQLPSESQEAGEPSLQPAPAEPEVVPIATPAPAGEVAPDITVPFETEQAQDQGEQQFHLHANGQVMAGSITADMPDAVPGSEFTATFEDDLLDSAEAAQVALSENVPPEAAQAPVPPKRVQARIKALQATGREAVAGSEASVAALGSKEKPFQLAWKTRDGTIVPSVNSVTSDNTITDPSELKVGDKVKIVLPTGQRVNGTVTLAKEAGVRVEIDDGQTLDESGPIYVSSPGEETFEARMGRIPDDSAYTVDAETGILQSASAVTDQGGLVTTLERDIPAAPNPTISPQPAGAAASTIIKTPITGITERPGALAAGESVSTEVVEPSTGVDLSTRGWKPDPGDPAKLQGYRAENAIGFGGSEGIGTYIARDESLAEFFGDPKSITVTPPSNPIIVDGEPLHILHETDEIMEPLAEGDSEWLTINKLAVQNAGVTDENWGQKGEELAKQLTIEASKRGYDGVIVNSGGEEWMVKFPARWAKAAQARTGATTARSRLEESLTAAKRIRRGQESDIRKLIRAIRGGNYAAGETTTNLSEKEILAKPVAVTQGPATFADKSKPPKEFTIDIPLSIPIGTAKTIKSVYSKADYDRGVEIIPLFQGNKREWAGRIRSVMNDVWTPEQLGQITELHDLFGGGGSWGHLIALEQLPNLQKLVVHELEEDRLAKIQFIHERGNEIQDIVDKGGLRQVLDVSRGLSIAENQGAGRSASALLNQERLNRAKEIALGQMESTEDVDIVLTAMQDRRERANIDNINEWIDKVIRDINGTYKAMQVLKDRGVKIEYAPGDSYKSSLPSGPETMVVADPPYFETTGYNGSNPVGIDIYNETSELLRRVKDQNSNLLYTDSAWWILDQIPLPNDMVEGYNTLNEIWNTLPRFDVASGTFGSSRREVIGANNAFELTRDEAGGDLRTPDDSRQAGVGVGRGTPADAGYPNSRLADGPEGQATPMAGGLGEQPGTTRPEPAAATTDFPPSSEPASQPTASQLERTPGSELDEPQYQLRERSVRYARPTQESSYPARRSEWPSRISEIEKAGRKRLDTLKSHLRAESLGSTAERRELKSVQYSPELLRTRRFQDAALTLRKVGLEAVPIKDNDLIHGMIFGRTVILSDSHEYSMDVIANHELFHAIDKSTKIAAVFDEARPAFAKYVPNDLINLLLQAQSAPSQTFLAKYHQRRARILRQNGWPAESIEKAAIELSADFYAGLGNAREMFGRDAPKAKIMRSAIKRNAGKMIEANPPGVGKYLKERGGMVVHAPTFYSNIEKGLETWQNKGTPEQLMKHLLKTKGTKGEAEWIGLGAFLEGKKSVTREEVQQFVAENQVTLQDIVKGGGQEPTKYILTEEGIGSLAVDAAESDTLLNEVVGENTADSLRIERAAGADIADRLVDDYDADLRNYIDAQDADAAPARVEPEVASRDLRDAEKRMADRIVEITDWSPAQAEDIVNGVELDEQDMIDEAYKALEPEHDTQYIDDLIEARDAFNVATTQGDDLTIADDGFRESEEIQQGIDARMRELGLPDGTAGGTVARQDPAIAQLMDELESPARRQAISRRHVSPTKYEQYTLPGGKNYRELLITLPSPVTPELEQLIKEKEAQMQSDTITETDRSILENQIKAIKAGWVGPQYSDPHYDEPNSLMHMRVNDRVTPDGKKILFSEEFQSKWSADLRKEGVVEHRALTEAEQEEWRTLLGNRETRAEEARFSALNDIRQGRGVVPDQPFSKNWHELSLKRLLRMAVEEGYDGIAWTTGMQQVKRWEDALRKQVDTIAWTRYDLENVQVKGSKNGNEIFDEAIPLEGKTMISGQEVELNSLLGKKMATDIRESTEPSGEFAGDNLAIGGQGFFHIYDSAVPNFLKKYTKKWGGEVTQVQISGAGSVVSSVEAQQAAVEAGDLPRDPSAGSRPPTQWESFGWERKRNATSTTIFGIRQDGRKVVQSSVGSPIGASSALPAEARGQASEEIAKRIVDQYNSVLSRLESAPEEGGQQGVMITPEMKRSIMFEGQPMFMLKGALAEKPGDDLTLQDLVQIRDEVIDEHKELRAAGQMIPQAEQTMLAELDTQITSMQGDIAEEQAAKELPKRARAAIRAGESAARLEERADWEEKLLEERAQAREAIADQRIDIAEAQKLVDAYIVQHLPPKQRDAAFKKIKALAKYAQPETRQKYVDKALEAIDEMEAEQERDLARNKLKADINKWTAELKKAQGKGKHSKLAETHAIRMAEYLDAITAVSLKKAATMRQAVEYFSDSGSEDYGDALGKKMADAMRPNINQMTREQLEQARADLNFIAKEGMLKGELQAVQRKRGLAREASLAAEVINKTSGVEKLGPLKRSLKRGRDKNRLLEAQREFFKRHSWSWMDPQRALWFMEGYDPSRPLHRAVWGRAAAAKDKKILATRAAVKSLQDDIIGDFNVTRAIKNDKDYAIEFTERQPDGTSKAASEPMTVEQMMFVYLHSKNPKQRAHLQATGWSDEMIDDVIANLPPEAKKVVQSIWVYTKGRQPAVSEVFAREHNVPMHAENSYFPIADLELRKGNELTPKNAIMSDAISRASVKKGFASQRSGDKSPFGRMEVFSTLARHIRDTEQYIAWNDATREINEILNDPALRQAMNDRNRAVAGDIREWMQLLAKGKTRRAESPVDKLSEWLRTNIAVSTIGMNIASVMKAPVSFFAGAQRLDNRFEAVHSLMRLLTHPKKTYGFVMDSSPPMSERSQNSERELSEIFEKSETGRWLKKNNPSQVYAEIKIAAMGLWRVADMVTTTSLWDARYREEIGKGKDHDAAVRAANELIETTQPMGGIMYLSPLRRGPGLARGLTWFTGQQSQNLNLVSETFNNWRGFKSAAGDSIWFVIIPAMLIFMASHGGRMPKTKKEWAVSMLDQVFGGLPIVREMIRGAASMLFGSGPEDRYNTEVMPVPLAPFEAIAKALPRKDWEKIVVELARIAGVPGVIQARRTYKGIKRFRETGDPRFLIWSPYALGKGGKKKKAKKIKPRG